MDTRPTRIAPPDDPIVTLDEAKSQCRVDFADDDALISRLISAAEGYLDGWGGALGRCMRSQEWREEFDGWGVLPLALPDVQSAVVTGYNEAGDVLAATQSDLISGFSGFSVVSDGPSDAVKVRVDYVCAMPALQLETARHAALMLIGHWYVNREAVSASGMQSVPWAFDILTNSLRLGRI